MAISRSHTGDGSNVVKKYLDRHEPLLAGGAGYKSLLVVDGDAEAYIHVTNIKVGYLLFANMIRVDARVMNMKFSHGVRVYNIIYTSICAPEVYIFSYLVMAWWSCGRPHAKSERSNAQRNYFDHSCRRREA